MEPVLDLLDDFVELAEAVPCFLFCLFCRISYEFDFKSPAVPVRV